MYNNIGDASYHSKHFWTRSLPTVYRLLYFFINLIKNNQSLFFFVSNLFNVKIFYKYYLQLKRPWCDIIKYECKFNKVKNKQSYFIASLFIQTYFATINVCYPHMLFIEDNIIVRRLHVKISINIYQQYCIYIQTN